MNRQEIKRLEENKVSIGQSFASFNALCRSVGIEPKNGGKERKYLEKRLRCYFDWERVKNTNRLIITEVFYHNPRPYADERNGIHTTPENESMQNLVLLTPELFSMDYTKRNILIQMQLISQKEPRNYRTNVYRDYEDRVYKLLTSAFIQLTKRGYISVNNYLCAQESGHVLTPEESRLYHQICRSLLSEYKVPSIRIINLQGRGEQFWYEINQRCQEQLHQAYIGRLYHLVLHSQYAQRKDLVHGIVGTFPLDVKERENLLNDTENEEFLRSMEHSRLLERVIANLAENYVASHENAIGVANPQQYKKDLQEIKASLTMG